MGTPIRTDSASLSKTVSLETAIDRLNGCLNVLMSQRNHLRGICGHVFGGYPDTPESETGPIAHNLVSRFHAELDNIERILEDNGKMYRNLTIALGDQSNAPVPSRA